MGTTTPEATGDATGSVTRVMDALRAATHPDLIQEFPDGTRTAADAASAIGCTVAQIAKSVIFRGGDTPVLVIASGASQVDTAKVAALTGLTIGRADGAWVRATTGFAIGGVAPVGHLTPPVVLVDEDLFALGRVWAAAGSPRHVFETTADALLRLTDGRRAAIALHS